MFLKHLKDKAERGEEEETSDMVVTGLDGVSGHTVFPDMRISIWRHWHTLKMGHSCQWDMQGSIMRLVDQ